MGSKSSKYNYKSVANSGDLVASEPPYGNLILIITIKERVFDNKHWFEKVPKFKLIISFLNIIRVEESLPSEKKNAVFNFMIPFNKSISKDLFSSPIQMDFDLSDGMNLLANGSLTLTDMKKSFLFTNFSNYNSNSKQKCPMDLQVEYGLFGKPLADDVKAFNLDFDINEQVENLEDTLDIALETDRDRWVPFHKGIDLRLPFWYVNPNHQFNEAWTEAKNEFKSGNFIDTLLSGVLKAGCAHRWMGENFKYLTFQRIFSIFYNNNERMVYPENLENFIQIYAQEPKFEYFIQEFVRESIQSKNKEIYKNKNFYKMMLLLCKEGKSDVYTKSVYFNENSTNYIFPTSSDIKELASSALEDCLSDDWFFNEFITPIIDATDEKAMHVLKRLFAWYGNIIKNYIKIFKDKITLEKLKQQPNYQFFINLIESPEFLILPLNVLQVFGHAETFDLDYCSTLNNYLVSFEKIFVNDTFSLKKSEKVITMVAECSSKREFYLTHVFLKTGKGKPKDKFSLSKPAKQALFFLTNDEPSIDDLQKFYDFKFEAFNNNEYSNLVENLKPIACIDLDKKTKHKNYDEIEFQEPIVGKYLIAIIQAGIGTVSTTIDSVGGLGFLSKEDFEKHGKLQEGGERVDLPDVTNLSKAKIFKSSRYV